MRRTCDNKQTNIVTEIFSIAHCHAFSAYCIATVITNLRAGLLELEWVSLSVTAILFCNTLFIVVLNEVEVQTTKRRGGFRIGILKS